MKQYCADFKHFLRLLAVLVFATKCTPLSMAEPTREGPDAQSGSVDCMTPQKQKAGKIEPNLLSRFETDPGGKVSVLVVLNVPEPKLSIKQNDPGSGFGKGIGLTGVTLPDTDVLAKAETRVRELLQELQTGDPVWLHSAQSFVVELDASQAQRIIVDPNALEIVPNATLR